LNHNWAAIKQQLGRKQNQTTIRPQVDHRSPNKKSL
jgi:hypothetical protein